MTQTGKNEGQARKPIPMEHLGRVFEMNMCILQPTFTHTRFRCFLVKATLFFVIRTTLFP